MRPVFFDFEQSDPKTAEIEDQFLFGPELLVAPVTKFGQRSRPVYLPVGTDWTDAWTGKKYEGGQTVEADAPTLMVVTVDAAEIEGTITTELESSNPHGTNMTVSLRIRARGILAAMFFPVVSRAIGSGFSRQIDEIAARIDQV